jgi:argininosuccinate synthase
MSRIVLAYSGSARSSVAIRWMIEAWQVEVVTLTLDLGQRDELDAVRERALACGAIRAHVLDERESFARDYLLPALRANAAYEDGRPLGRALTRALIGRRLVEVARMEGVTEVAHACDHNYDDRVRLECAIHDAGPDMLARAPLVEASLSDAELLSFAEAHDVPVARIRSHVDANVFERCTQVAALNGAPSVAADPQFAASHGAESSQQSVGDASRGPASHGPVTQAAPLHGAPSHAAQSHSGAENQREAFDIGDAARGHSQMPDVPAVVSIEFSAGTPVGLNGVTMPLLEILSTLDTLASAHGIGQTQQLVRVAGAGAVEQQQCDAPAATLLNVALRQFERLLLSGDAWRDAQQIGALYRDIVFRGAWGSVSRRGCDAFVGAIQAKMTGAVRLRLFKGSVSVIDCASASATAFADAAR